LHKAWVAALEALREPVQVAQQAQAEPEAWVLVPRLLVRAERELLLEEATAT